jgi:hypothetical protein
VDPEGFFFSLCIGNLFVNNQKIRRAKFLRTGMTYGVASGSTAEEVSVCPKVVVAKDMFSAYLNNHSVPLLTEPLVQNPLEWVECADTPENIVYQEGSEMSCLCFFVNSLSKVRFEREPFKS